MQKDSRLEASVPVRTYQYVLRLVGFGFLMAWLYTIFPRNVLAPAEVAAPSLLFTGPFHAALMGVFLVAAFFPSRINGRRRVFGMVMCIAAVLGTAGISAAFLSGLPQQSWFIAPSAAMAGVGYAGMQLVWLQQLRPAGGESRIAFVAVGAYAVVCAVLAALRAVPQSWTPGFTALMPIVSWACLSILTRSKSVQACSDSLPPVRMRTGLAVAVLRAVSIAAGQLLLLYLWGTRLQASASGAVLVYTVCAIVMALIAYAIVRNLDKGIFSPQIRVPLVVVVTSLMAFSLVQPLPDTGAQGVLGIAWLAAMFGSALFFTVLVGESRHLSILPMSFYGGTLAAAFSVSLVLQVFAGLLSAFASPLLLVVANVLITSSIIFPPQHPSPSTGIGRSISIAAACERIAKTYGLTHRETEVLALLAEGRSVPFISDLLVIAPGTGRAHVNHIYQKIAVHNRQELINFVIAATETDTGASRSIR